jgi:hypothetical protein
MRGLKSSLQTKYIYVGTELMRRTIAVLLGLPITFITLALIAGSIENAWLILSMSVVCTAGISLVIWIPLWWFVGWVIIKIFESLTGRTVGGEATGDAVYSTPTGQSVPVSSDQKSLIDYIEKASRNGLSETQITSRLKAQGWKDEEIQQAQDFLGNSLGGN